MPETREWPTKAELIFNRNVAKWRREKVTGVYSCYIHHKRNGEMLIRVLQLEERRPHGCHLREGP